MSQYPAATSGLGVATRIGVDAKVVTLSLSGVNTHQIVPSVQDASGSVVSGAVFPLTAVAASSGQTAVYTGTFSATANAHAGQEFVVSGFSNAANSGTFVATASTATSVTLDNAAAVAETHAATATREGNAALTFISRNPAFVTVSASGLITGAKKGHATVEVYHPAFGNAHGVESHGIPLETVFAEVGVRVTL